MSYDYALIKRNIKRAIEIVTAHPETNFDLSSFKEETACGTNFCTAGLLFEQREFRIQLEQTELCKENRHKTPGLLAHSEEMFGPFCYHRLFAAYAEGVLDKEWMGDCLKYPTHKELALLRLNHYLQELSE